MRCMKLIIVAGEIIFFTMLAAAAARGQEFPPLPQRPTVVAARPLSGGSASPAQPVRVTITNDVGQTTTLEYRTPVRIVADSVDSDFDEGQLVPLKELPVLSTPARSEDLQQVNYQSPLTEITSLREVRYEGQPTYAQPVSTLPLVPTGGPPAATYSYAPQTTVTQYAPAPTYAAPNYSVPVTGVPQTVYRPVTTLPPVVRNDVQIGSGIYGQPTIYRPGQPLRNILRWLTP